MKMNKYSETENARKELYSLASKIQREEIHIPEWQKRGVYNMLILAADSLGTDRCRNKTARLYLCK